MILDVGGERFTAMRTFLECRPETRWPMMIVRTKMMMRTMIRMMTMEYRYEPVN